MFKQNLETDRYMRILCPDGIPDFLMEYAAAPEMARLAGIGLFCGTDYSRVYRHRYFFSRLDHSLGVALIVWRFTRDRAQAIAGLLHDISCPVFSHSVDFMNGDALTQSSTEAHTRRIIARSAHIMALLARDNIPLDAVADYHIYPIADNHSPRLCADRLEYTLSTMLVWHGGWGLTDIAAIMDDLTVLTAHDCSLELGFASLDSATHFTQGACAIGIAFQRNDNKLSLNMLGDILSMALSTGTLTAEELYTLTEAQAIAAIESSEDEPLRAAWRNYTHLRDVYGADQRPSGGYSVCVEAKRRYINTLVMHAGGAARAHDVSIPAKHAIDELLAFTDKPYAYVDFQV